MEELFWLAALVIAVLYLCYVVYCVLNKYAYALGLRENLIRPIIGGFFVWIVIVVFFFQRLSDWAGTIVFGFDVRGVTEGFVAWTALMTRWLFAGVPLVWLLFRVAHWSTALPRVQQDVLLALFAVLAPPVGLWLATILYVHSGLEGVLYYWMVGLWLVVLVHVGVKAVLSLIHRLQMSRLQQESPTTRASFWIAVGILVVFGVWNHVSGIRHYFGLP